MLHYHCIRPILRYLQKTNAIPLFPSLPCLSVSRLCGAQAKDRLRYHAAVSAR